VAVAKREGVPVSVAIALIRERAILLEQQRVTFAYTCRDIADQSLEDENIAMAVWNYRRAAFVAPHTEAGQTAARAIGVLQKDAETELKAINQLIDAQEFDQAIKRLDELRRDYSGLSIAPKIEQARRRAVRLQASERVAKAEPRVGSDRAASEPPAARVVEPGEAQVAQPPNGSDRDTFASIRKLAGLTRQDSAVPRLRGYEPRR
jgi:hypothetical protein